MVNIYSNNHETDANHHAQLIKFSLSQICGGWGSGISDAWKFCRWNDTSQYFQHLMVINLPATNFNQEFVIGVHVPQLQYAN